MPSAALSMQSVGCRHHLFKMSKDHSGHSGQVAALLMHAWLDYESVLRTPLSNMTHLVLCVQVVFQQHSARWRVTQSSLDDSACCVLQDCGRTDFGLKWWGMLLQQNCAQSVALLHSAHEAPMVTRMQRMLSVPSWMENIWNQMLTCPHLFQKLNFILEIIKF